MSDLVSVITEEVKLLHEKWARGEPGGQRLITASGKVVIGADLIGADLRGSNLSEADLSGAYLSEADLSEADLRGADLSGADLRGSNLRGADLRGSNLRGSNLSRSNLSGANLRGADLSEAYLIGSNLSRSNLSGADLRGAYLRGAKNIPDYVSAVTRIVPDGVFTAYKKARTENGAVLLTLEIPAGAKRSNATGRKCRAEFAIVRGIEGIGWQYDGSPVHSQYDGDFVYPPIGERITPSGWDEDRWDECAPGVHLFITRYEAENY